MKKTFILRAFATFEAESLDHALTKLSHHFLSVSLFERSMEFIGEIEVKPEGKKDEPSDN